MSKLVVGYVIIAGLLPVALAGQDLRAMRERLERETQLAQQANDSLTAYRAPERRYRTAADTIVIAGGNLTVLADRNIATTARAAALQADSLLRQIDDVLPRIKGDKVYITLDTSAMRRRVGFGTVIIRYSSPPHRHATEAYAQVDVVEIARQIEGTASGRAANLGRTPFVFWRRGNLPLRSEDVAQEPDWSNTRFDILESPSVLGPRCYRGDIVACSMQLGLTPVDDPVMAWYDSLTRIETVRENRDRAMRFNAAATQACLAGNDQACGRTLHTIHALELPPAGTFARDALVWQAIQLGGDGAVERLITHPGTAAEAIAAAARVPADSVIKVWQRNLREGSLGSNDLTITMFLVAVGWVAVLAFLSTRITRWR